MSLVCAQIFVTQQIDREGVTAGDKKIEQLADLGFICADRVRTAVRFKLKPAEVFGRSGLQIEGHVEAV
jgi:hypothetical protein